MYNKIQSTLCGIYSASALYTLLYAMVYTRLFLIKSEEHDTESSNYDGRLNWYVNNMGYIDGFIRTISTLSGIWVSLTHYADNVRS
uniref:Uncharacterized protein n=1 Tax=viral metagenome TaxID=1070528 RepID=A0A6C0CBJ5_9ZZZZ